MSKQNDTKIDPLLSFPVGAFLMVRLEYVQIFQDEIQAKLLRVIESHIETQRTVLYRDAVNKGKATTIPKDIFVPISYKLFMNDLFGTVASETTIKKGLNKLIECRVIFRKEPANKRYAAPEYSINTEGLQMLLDTLKNPGYQKLIPSIIDTLKKRYPQNLVPSGYQKLIPSNKNSSSDEKSRVSEIDTNIREKNITSKNERMQSATESDSLSHSSTPTSSLEHLSTPNVDKQASSVDNSNKPQLPIATVTTGNASTTPNARNTEPLLSPDGQRVQGYWSQLGFESTSASHSHWNTLSKHIASFEQMNSLYEYTRAQLATAKDPTVHPGNLVKAVNGWKQKQAPPPEKPSQPKSGKPRDLGAEMRKMREQYTGIAASGK